MGKISVIERAIDEGRGVVRLAPTWVPRSFCRPGRRLRLHPDDYFSLGLSRGGIDERWFSSTTPADNGPGTPEDEGLSYIVTADGKERALLTDAVAHLKGGFIGEALYGKYGRWPMFSKFFDNMGPLPHHIHHDDAHAGLVGESGKPEMYFFPAQYNNYGAEFPFTFFGINPGVPKEQVKKALQDFIKGDNHLLELSPPTRSAWTPAGTCPGVRTRRRAFAPTSPSSPPTCTPCTKACSITITRFRRTCYGRTARRIKSATMTI
jgi:hypothetical protein